MRRSAASLQIICQFSTDFLKKNQRTICTIMAKFSKDRFYKDRTGFIPVLVSNKEIKLVCPGQHFPHYKSMGNFLDSQVKGMTRGSTIFPIIE